MVRNEIDAILILASTFDDLLHNNSRLGLNWLGWSCLLVLLVAFLCLEFFCLEQLFLESLLS